MIMKKATVIKLENLQMAKLHLEILFYMKDEA